MHIIDREQIWMPVGGEFEVDVEGKVERAAAGQAVVLPGKDDRIPLPWAE
ncbi:hypothetical protein ACOKM5_03775 [Streptomyces sp. BH097]